MKREFSIGIITVVLSFLLLMQAEYRNFEKNRRSERSVVLIDQDQAHDQVVSKLGTAVDIAFVRELKNNYYFEVTDPAKDSIYDVYVDKYQPKVHTYRKGGVARK